MSVSVETKILNAPSLAPNRTVNKLFKIWFAAKFEFAELGLAIKKASPFKRTFVISICNDRPSYVPTLKAFGEGSYEITNARVKPGVGETLVDTAVELLKELK